MNVKKYIQRIFKKGVKETGTISEEVSSFISEEAQLIRQRVDTRRAKQRKLKIVLGTLLSLVVIFGSIALYSQYKLRTLTRAELQDSIPKESQPRTGEEIVKALGRLVLLPEGVPQIAEVQDVDRLKKSQSFFENAENGDVVVVYDNDIYLYRPSKDIIIGSGKINETTP